MYHRPLQYALLILLLLVAPGCSDREGLIPVSGRVTFNGGEMPGKGYLRFVPLKVEQGYQRRPGMALFETDGKCEVRSFQPGDGLYPGEYAVFPFCWEVEPSMDGPPEKSYLPKKYADPRNPPFRIAVNSESSPIEFAFNIEP